jgi:hypothetical protein
VRRSRAERLEEAAVNRCFDSFQSARIWVAGLRDGIFGAKSGPKWSIQGAVGSGDGLSAPAKQHSGLSSPRLALLE